MFFTIPHATRYEMNNKGVVRNRQTGKILKWGKGIHGTPTLNLYLDDGKKICATLPNLMWLMHGDIVSKTRPVPTVVKKGTRSLSFDSLKQCALFLGEVTHLTYDGVWYHLHRRHKKIADWYIHYCY